MPAVDPTSTNTAPAAAFPASADRATPGFAAVLSDVRAAGTVTLGQMVGLQPVHGLDLRAADTAKAMTTGTPGAPGSGHPVLDSASAYLGVPYLWGGTDPATGLDCSGLVQRAFADIGVDVPRVSADQARAGIPVDGLAEARPGDLVYWAGRGGRPNHIGIYMGDGKMLHAPRTGDVVRVADVRTAAPDAIRRIA
jgi:cell wall-associated NlpC family hydrolase